MALQQEARTRTPAQSASSQEARSARSCDLRLPCPCSEVVFVRVRVRVRRRFGGDGIVVVVVGRAVEAVHALVPALKTAPSPRPLAVNRATELQAIETSGAGTLVTVVRSQGLRRRNRRLHLVHGAHDPGRQGTDAADRRQTDVHGPSVIGGRRRRVDPECKANYLWGDPVMMLLKQRHRLQSRQRARAAQDGRRTS